MPTPPALEEQRHVVEEEEHLGGGLVDRGEDSASAPRELLQQLHNIVSRVGVEARGRLVEEDQVG